MYLTLYFIITHPIPESNNVQQILHASYIYNFTFYFFLL